MWSRSSSSWCLAFALGLGCGTNDAPPPLASEASALTACATSPTTTFGIDVSKWQGTIDWAKVASDSVVFAFIRVSDGTGYIDAKFGPNWAGAQANGILRGAYQFFRADEDPEEQAQILLDHLAEHGAGELPPVIDVESADGQTPATVAANVRRWIDIVEAATGQEPIIYSGRYFWDGSVKDTTFGDSPLWVAQWTSASCATLPAGWSQWTFWQYSASGTVKGISGDVDLDRFDGTRDELVRLGANVGCGDCGLGASCEPVDGVSTCVDLRCTTHVGGADGSVCLGAATVLRCELGVANEVACTSGDVCGEDSGDARCEAASVAPDPVAEASPEPAPEAGPEPTPEPTPETDVVNDAAPIAGTPSRSLRVTEHTPPGGCGGGPAPVVWLVLAVLWSWRRASRSGARPIR